MRLMSRHTSSLALIFRIIVVASLNILAISYLVQAAGKDIVSDFITAQNNVFIVSGWSSLGLHSMFMYYGNRGIRYLSWPLSQYMLLFPLQAFIAIIFAYIIELALPSLGFAPVFISSLAVAVSTALPGVLLGLGYFRAFSIIEIVSAATFLLTCFLTIEIGISITSTWIVYIFVFSHILKIMLYIFVIASIVPFSAVIARSKRGLSTILIWRFIGPSLISGNLAILYYRSTLNVLISLYPSRDAEIAVIWAYFDRVQNIVGAVNTYVYRFLSRSSLDRSRFFSKLTLAYLLLGSAFLFIYMLALHIIFAFAKTSISIDAYIIGVFFFLWGYRSIVQNAIAAIRRFDVILRDVIGLLTAQVILISVIKLFVPGWLAGNAIVVFSLLISILHLRRRLQ